MKPTDFLHNANTMILLVNKIFTNTNIDRKSKVNNFCRLKHSSQLILSHFSLEYLLLSATDYYCDFHCAISVNSLVFKKGKNLS